MRKILLFFVGCLVSFTLYAEPNSTETTRTDEEVLFLARQLIGSQPTGMKRMPASQTLTIAERTKAYCAVNTGRGFILVGADSRLPNIIGWTDNGQFDKTTMPDALLYWLDMYEAEVASLDFSETDTPATMDRSGMEVFDDEQMPLLTTEWGQGDPYNKKCPSSSVSTRCLTGCVATAMAQIMRFYRYPQQGNSSHTYTWKCSDCGQYYTYSQQLTANFETMYDWSNMKDKYTSYTAAEADAVSTLMYHCGVAVEMGYGANASGANLDLAANALYTYFGYGKDIVVHPQNMYPADQLMRIIHDDISLGHPVLVSGHNSSSGHAFVCDGYTRSGYFHFNWGWNGAGNGFFLLTALNPIANNSFHTYNDEVRFITNIRPDSSETTQPHCQIFCEGLQAIPVVARHDSATIWAYELRNRSAMDFYGRIGLGLYDEQKDSLLYRIWQSDTVTLPVGGGWGWKRYRMRFVVPDSIPNGTYVANILYKQENGSMPWEKVSYALNITPPKICIGDDDVMFVSSDRLSITGNPDLSLTAASMKAAHNVKNRTDTIDITIDSLANTNDEDFHGYWAIAIYDSKDSLLSLSVSSNDMQYLRAGYTYDAPVSFSLAVPQSVPSGTYRLRAISKSPDGDWKKILSSDASPIEEVLIVSEKIILLGDMPLQNRVRFGTGDTISLSGARLLFALPDDIRQCEFNLAAVWSNQRTGQTDTIKAHKATLTGGSAHWDFYTDQLYHLLSAGVLVTDTVNTFRLMWNMDNTEIYHDFTPEGYNVCYFYMSETIVPANSDTLTCSEAAAMLPYLTHNVPEEQIRTVIGYVTTMQNEGISRGQQWFWMADAPSGGKVFQCYWGNVQEEVFVGDKVAVTGHLMRYNDAVEIKNGQVDILRHASDMVEGEFNGIFSINSNGGSVFFSKGNLQYQATTQTWRFADHQYDYVGNSNSSISSTYSGWIDLFGWGTSGWKSGAISYQPYATSSKNSDYCPGGSSANSLTGNYANADWGVYNAISNGGNKPGLWRTLTYDEWNYIFYSRPQADRLRGQAQVNNIDGYVLLPDDFVLPVGMTFVPVPDNMTSNVYTATQWVQMEEAGAVFLPCAGTRYTPSNNTITGDNFWGRYWSSTPYQSDYAYFVFFSSTTHYIKHFTRCSGLSVRLVQDIRTQDVENVPTGKAHNTKIMRDGQILILRGDKTYTLTGQELK